jgi:hypothetical protein
MKKFLVIYSGEEGCDYSIGCGRKISHYEAENLIELISIIHEEQYEDGPENTCEDYRNYFSRSDNRFKDIEVWATPDDYGMSIKSQLERLIDRDKKKLSEIENNKAVDEEVALYQKLHEKYGR